MTRFLLVLVLFSCSKGDSNNNNGNGGNSGNTNASFTVSCNPVVSGLYNIGDVLNSSHYITIPVNVTNKGNWSLSTSASGMTFSGSGNFSSTGNQNVTLNGSGTVTGSGTFNVSGCSFSINMPVQGSQLFRSANSFNFFYGNGEKPYYLGATNFGGGNGFELDSSSIATGLKIELHNIINPTLSEIGSSKFLKLANVSSATTESSFNAVTDTAGKVYVLVRRKDGQNMTVSGVINPVNVIILPLVSVSDSRVGNSSFVAKQANFTLAQMLTVYTTNHPSNPEQQGYIFH